MDLSWSETPFDELPMDELVKMLEGDLNQPSSQTPSPTDYEHTIELAPHQQLHSIQPQLSQPSNSSIPEHVSFRKQSVQKYQPHLQQQFIFRLIEDKSLLQPMDHVNDIEVLRNTLEKLQFENSLLKQLLDVVRQSQKSDEFGYVISDGRNAILFMDDYVRRRATFTETEEIKNWEQIIEPDSYRENHVRVLTAWINKMERLTLHNLVFYNKRSGVVSCASSVEIDNFYDSQTNAILFCVSRVYF